MYCVIDLKTTGLDHNYDQIIEIGAVKVRVDGLVLDEFHTYVSLSPGNTLNPFITELTGITEDMLDPKLNNLPTEEQALRDLEVFIGDSVVVCHYVPFDLAFLASRGKIIPEKFLCTRSLVKLIEPHLSSSLKDVCERNGIKLNHHRALHDVYATIEVLNIYKNKVGDITRFYNIIVESPDRPLKYIPHASKVISFNTVIQDQWLIITDCQEEFNKHV